MQTASRHFDTNGSECRATSETRDDLVGCTVHLHASLVTCESPLPRCACFALRLFKKHLHCTLTCPCCFILLYSPSTSPCCGCVSACPFWPIDEVHCPSFIVAKRTIPLIAPALHSSRASDTLYDTPRFWLLNQPPSRTRSACRPCAHFLDLPSLAFQILINQPQLPWQQRFATKLHETTPSAGH